MVADGHYTNSSCGFHVGVSLDTNQMRELDPLKLALIFDARDVLEAFDRSNNRFCKPIREYLNTNIDARVAQWVITDIHYGVGPNDARIDIEGRIRGMMPQDKYCATNISKLRSAHGAYVEFRGMGGADYHQRFPEIKDYIEYYGEVMEAAAEVGVHPDHDRRFRRELGRLVRSVKKKYDTIRVQLAEQERNAAAARAENERRQREQDEQERVRQARERAERERRAQQEREAALLERQRRDAARVAARGAYLIRLRQEQRARALKKQMAEDILWNQALQAVSGMHQMEHDRPNPIYQYQVRDSLRAEWAKVRRAQKVNRNSKF
jgi:hypothetical protein